MRPTKIFGIALCGLVGCIEPRPDATPVQLQLEPARLAMTVVDGVPVVQTFRATLIDSDGVARDVTAETAFALADRRAGSWSADTLSLGGDVLGPMQVTATYGALRAQADLTVFARDLRYVAAPVDAALTFERAMADTSCAPAISYPADGVVLPQNLGALDVQWADARDDLFEVSLATTYLETRIYTRRGSVPSAFARLAAEDWTRLAGQHESIELRVSGLVEDNPKLACRSLPRLLQVTEQPLVGGLYVMSAGGIARYDAAQPMLGAAPVVSPATWDAMMSPLVGPVPAACMGCALSRDGSRFAVASGTHAAIYEIASHTVTDPGQTWDSATFTAASSTLVTSRDGNLHVITDAGATLAKLEPASGYAMFDAQLSRDGHSLASVLSTGNAPTLGGTIEVRPFAAATISFGAAHAIMPLVPGVSAYAPAWSPDGQWIAFTRATGWGTLETKASIWIAKADGSTTPVQLTDDSPDLDVHARFAPLSLTTGGERMFYVTFESDRAFGELGTGTIQLWATPFYPDRPVLGTGLCTAAEAQTGACPTRAVAPAFRLPMQSVSTDNRLVQWLAPVGA